MVLVIEGVKVVILKEEFTKQRCQDIFKDMLEEFDYSSCLYGAFDKDAIEPRLTYLNSNNRKVLGRCRRERDHSKWLGYKYTIMLNPNCLKFGDEGESVIRNTLAHELCHTLPDCMNHGPNFMEWAGIIGRNMGYVIDKTADVDGSKYFEKYIPMYPYMLRCRDCDKEFYHAKQSDSVKNPGRYKCNCGGVVDSYILNDQTDGYDLFRSADGELDYPICAKCSNCDFFKPFKTRNREYKMLLKALDNGDSLGCPRCGKETVYLVDNGVEYHDIWSPK
jgi:predicted SprT family Zn-dependent metalloprotease